jgi:hypothetical protein
MESFIKPKHQTLPPSGSCFEFYIHIEELTNFEPTERVQPPQPQHPQYENRVFVVECFNHAPVLPCGTLLVPTPSASATLASLYLSYYALPEVEIREIENSKLQSSPLLNVNGIRNPKPSGTTSQNTLCKNKSENLNSKTHHSQYQSTRSTTCTLTGAT